MTITKQCYIAMHTAMNTLAELLLAENLNLAQIARIRNAHDKLYNSLNGVPERQTNPKGCTCEFKHRSDATCPA